MRMGFDTLSERVFVSLLNSRCRTPQAPAGVEILEPRLLLASYFVRADGAAANLASAGGPVSDPAHCLSLARVNAAAFAPGDTVWFSSAGGTFNGLFSPVASGMPGAPVTYTGISGESTGPATIKHIWGVPVKAIGLHDVVIEGFSIVANSDHGVYLGTSATNIVLRDLAIDAGGSGVLVYDTFNGLTLENITTSSRVGTYCLYVADLTSPGKDLTVRGLTASAGAVRIRQVTNLTLEDIHLANVTQPGATAFLVEASSGTLSLARGSVTSCAGMGLMISGGHFTSALVDQFTVTAASQTSIQVSDSSGITFTHCSALNGMDNGFRIMGGCSFIAIEDCLASDNLGDGYDTANPFTHDIVFRRCQALYNGDKNDPTKSSGDGFSSHHDNYNILLDSCVAIGNIVSGVAMVGTSAGTISNCLFLNNGGDWTAEGGQQMFRGGLFLNLDGPNPYTGGSWVVRDSVSAGSYPFEVNISFAGSTRVNLDYNSYYSSPGALGFARLSETGAYISWADYAPREPHSTYGPPVVDEIRGMVWNDLNADGVRNAGESAIAGRTVSLNGNGNGNGELDPGELSTVTGVDGRYAFTDLPDGDFRPRAVPSPPRSARARSSSTSISGWGWPPLRRTLLISSRPMTADRPPSITSPIATTTTTILRMCWVSRSRAFCPTPLSTCTPTTCGSPRLPRRRPGAAWWSRPRAATICPTGRT
jgi:SdrD B-like domain/Right handed beta helix region